MNINDYIVHLICKDPYFSKQSPKEINNGKCEDFAMALEEKFPLGEMSWGDALPHKFGEFHEPDAHCFFIYEDKYYDSECPTGVSSPADLPFYRRQEAYVKLARANSKHSNTNPFPKDGSFNP